MSVYVSPAGLATTALTANQISITASFSERLCRNLGICCGSNLPITINYTYGQPILVGSTVFVPVTATISFSNMGNNSPKYTENFDVSFQGQTAVPSSVNINSVGRIIHVNGRCLLINDSLTIALVSA